MIGVCLIAIGVCMGGANLLASDEATVPGAAEEVVVSEGAPTASTQGQETAMDEAGSAAGGNTGQSLSTAGTQTASLVIGNEAPAQSPQTQPVALTQSVAAPSAPPSPPPSFHLKGLYIGMDLADAKVVLDRLLGFESTPQQDAFSDNPQLNGGGYAIVTADRSNKVIRVEFTQAFIDHTYQAEGLGAKDFSKKFAKSTGIKLEIDIARKNTTWEYASPDGFKLTISSNDKENKILILEKI